MSLKLCVCDTVHLGAKALLQTHSVQCIAVRCIVVRFSAVRCSTVQYSAVHFSEVQCSAVQYSAVQCSVLHMQACFSCVWVKSIFTSEMLHSFPANNRQGPEEKSSGENRPFGGFWNNCLKTRDCGA